MECTGSFAPIGPGLCIICLGLNLASLPSSPLRSPGTFASFYVRPIRLLEMCLRVHIQTIIRFGFHREPVVRTAPTEEVI